MASPTGITTRPYNHLTLPSSSPSHLCHPTTTSLITLPTPTITTPSPTNDTSTRNYHRTTISPPHPPMASLTTLQPLDTTIILIMTPLSSTNDITKNTTYTTTITNDNIHNTTTTVTNIPPSWIQMFQGTENENAAGICRIGKTSDQPKVEI